MDPRRVSQVSTQTHNRSDTDYADLPLNWSHATSWYFNHWYKIYRGAAQDSDMETSGVVQDADMKALRNLSLPRYIHQDRTISEIHESDSMFRSSPCSKCCNAPISKRAVMNDGGHPGMAISAVKQHNLSSYKEIITCKSSGYADLK